MSSSTPRDAGLPPDAPTDVRALPPRPSLEFERKQARRLLRQLHAGDPGAIARVRARQRASRHTAPDEFQLADAQFAIAREYGFTSWPRLVEYFTTLARHLASGPLGQGHPRDFQEALAQTLLRRHRDGRNEAAQVLAAFVPRLYGRSADQVLAASVTIDDARLAQARMHRYPSWEVMLAEDRPHDEWAWQTSPRNTALRAIRAEDATALAEVVRQHPELLTESEAGQPGNIRLVRNAFLHDLRTGAPGTRRLIEWLGTRVDIRSTLNWMLLGHLRMPTSAVRLLLEAGADPSWVPPNGISVVEHAIVRYWNAEAVDLVAASVDPPRSFWVAAGLGDVAAVARYVDRAGVPTEAARRHRPDFTAIFMGLLPFNPSADDQAVLWEAFLVAAFNQRFGVLDLLLQRGFPIDYMAWGQPILQLAVGNGWTPLVEYLVRNGADPTRTGPGQSRSARDIAESGFVNPHGYPDKRRILALCGGRDADVLLREHEEQQGRRIMQTHHMVEAAFTAAKVDALRQGRSAVAPENLLVGMLQEGRLPLNVLSAGGVDLVRLRDRLADRLAASSVAGVPEMTSDADATAVLMAARSVAEGHKAHALFTVHVFAAMLADCAHRGHATARARGRFTRTPARRGGASTPQLGIGGRKGLRSTCGGRPR